MDKNNSLAIVVMTSDIYFSLVEGFIYFFKKNSYYRNCVVYFGCETKTLDDYENFRFVRTKETSWSKRLYSLLKCVSEDNVLLLLEDYFFLHGNNHKIIKEVTKQFLESNFDTLNITKNYRYEDEEVNFDYLKTERPIINFLDRESFEGRYYLTCGTMYKTRFLRTSLRKNENAWEFEINASFRAKHDKDCSIGILTLGSFNFGFPHTGVIARGKLISEFSEQTKNQGFNILWDDLNLAVTTKSTSLILRLMRIPNRYLKKYLNFYLNKLYL